jgi:hypothetical protein
MKNRTKTFDQKVTPEDLGRNIWRKNIKTTQFFLMKKILKQNFKSKVI